MNQAQLRRFKEQQAKLVAERSPERKAQEKELRETLEQEYKDTHGWYDGDNQANSPLEADKDE